jgi:hypothetical protein
LLRPERLPPLLKEAMTVLEGPSPYIATAADEFVLLPKNIDFIDKNFQGAYKQTVTKIKNSAAATTKDLPTMQKAVSNMVSYAPPGTCLRVT